jgi:hypothetical protein
LTDEELEPHELDAVSGGETLVTWPGAGKNLLIDSFMAGFYRGCGVIN